MRVLLALALVFSAVSGVLLGAVPARADPRPWRTAITEPDRRRLALLWRAWRDARDQIAAAGHADELTKLGDIADPALFAEGGPPAPGNYRCRTIKLGARTPGMPVMVMAAARPCRIEEAGEFLRLVSPLGAQRTAGLLYPDDDRMIYLGAVSLGSESGLFAYKRDAERDQVGVLHRIGAARWRLELPWPKWESALDIVEITPAG